MKKLSVFLALVLLLTINVGAEEYILNEDFGTPSERFTEDIADDTHFVKYDAENADIYARNSDGNGGQTGTITLDSAVTGVIDISFDFYASDDHVRLKMLFLNENGRQIHTNNLYRLARTGKVYLTDSNMSSVDTSFPKADPGQRMYVQMKIDTENKTADYKIGLDGENGIEWTEWTTGKTLELLDSENLNLKSIAFKNEYLVCNVHVDNISVSGMTAAEGGEDDTDSDIMEYAVPEEDGYTVVYKNDFRTDSGAEFTGTNTNDTHYAIINAEKHRAETYNSDATGSCSVKLKLPDVYKKDGTRVGFTFYSGTVHTRMKSLYYNASGEQIHQNNILLRDTGVVIGDNSASMISSALPVTQPQSAGRVEVEFDFTNRKVGYRVGHTESGKWVYSAWRTGYQVYSASSETEMSLAQIVFSNEYAVCDMYVDDVYVMVPQVKPEAKNLAITGMKLDTPISKDILTAEYEYYEENAVAEGESEVTWYASETADFKNETAAGSGKTLALNSSYAGKYIRFKVKPVGVNGKEGLLYTSPAAGPVELVEDGGNPPIATDISVSGNCYVGSTVKVEYSFYDEDYDNEADTLIEWYIDDKLIKSGSGKTAVVFELLKEYEGKCLKVVITPHSDGETASVGESAAFEAGEVKESPAYYDYAELTTSPAGGSTVTGNIYLPIKGANGSQIVWSSSNPSVIAADGTVRRTTSNTAVTLTAVISSDGISYTKEFTYTVAKQASASGGGGSSGGSGGGSSYIISGGSVQTTPPPADTKTDEMVFTDLDGYSWAEKEIMELYEKGVVSGDGDNCFHPERNVTRAEFIQMIVKYFGINGSAELAFSDVSEQDWYYSCISAAVSAGIASGMSTDYFGAKEELTREDMTVILCRVKKFSAKAEYTELFADDANISGYAKDSVYTLKQLGVISGMDEGRFEPKGSARRAEAARIICVSGN